MKKIILGLILLALGTGTGYSQTEQNQSPSDQTPGTQNDKNMIEVQNVPVLIKCAKMEDIKKVIDLGGVTPSFSTSSNDGEIFTLWVNPQNHYWAITLFYVNQPEIGCIVSIGKGYIINKTNLPDPQQKI